MIHDHIKRRDGPKIVVRVGAALFNSVWHALYDHVDAYVRSKIEVEIDQLVSDRTPEDMLEDILMEHYDTL